MAVDDPSFEKQLRHARGCIARQDHVREWSLFAVQLIAHRCLEEPLGARADGVSLVREAELLLGGVMTSEVDARVFHAGALVLHLKLQRAPEGEERHGLAVRARQLFESALGAALPSTELLLDYALFELDGAHAGDAARALALVARAGSSEAHLAQIERLRARLAARLQPPPRHVA